MDKESFLTDRRRQKRFASENEMTISFPSEGQNLPGEKIIYTVSRDISATGARIQAHRFLPVNTPLKIKVEVKNPPRMVTTLAKVKWIRSVFADEIYEAGLEFSTPLN